jgi:hypothetical protein
MGSSRCLFFGHIGEEPVESNAPEVLHKLPTKGVGSR